MKETDIHTDKHTDRQTDIHHIYGPVLFPLYVLCAVKCLISSARQ